MKPMVSICCITYNHEKYIAQAIEGFLTQKTSFPIEILIHDDASTDKTADIIKEYEKKHPDLIKPVFQTENQYSKGVKPTSSFLFPRASGKYIALCEGDDYWTDPSKLQKQVDFLEANPDYVICYHNAIVIDENGTLLSHSKLPQKYKRDFSSDDLMKAARVLTLSMCYRNVIVQYPEEYSHVFNGDRFLTSLLGGFGKGKYLPEITPSVYRVHSTSIWSSQDRPRQLLHSFITRSWLHRYYERTGKPVYSAYFRITALNDFSTGVIIILENDIHLYDKIIQSIIENHKTIINTSSTPKLIQELAISEHLENYEQYKLSLETDPITYDDHSIHNTNTINVKQHNVKSRSVFLVCSELFRLNKDDHSRFMYIRAAYKFLNYNLYNRYSGNSFTKNITFFLKVTSCIRNFKEFCFLVAAVLPPRFKSQLMKLIARYRPKRVKQY